MIRRRLRRLPKGRRTCFCSQTRALWALPAGGCVPRLTELRHRGCCAFLISRDRSSQLQAKGIGGNFIFNKTCCSRCHLKLDWRCLRHLATTPCRRSGCCHHLEADDSRPLWRVGGNIRSSGSRKVADHDRLLQKSLAADSLRSFSVAACSLLPWPVWNGVGHYPHVPEIIKRGDWKIKEKKKLRVVQEQSTRTAIH